MACAARPRSLFAMTILSLPPQAVAPLVVLFAVYVAADGAFAILAGMRAARWGYRWPMLILEGWVNLAAAAAVLVWQAVAAVPLVHIATAGGELFCLFTRRIGARFAAIRSRFTTMSVRNFRTMAPRLSAFRWTARGVIRLTLGTTIFTSRYSPTSTRKGLSRRSTARIASRMGCANAPSS